MPLRTFYTLDVNGVHRSQEYSEHPSEKEIEDRIKTMFPEGYIYDQFANTKIFPVATVHKHYTLID